MDRIELPLISVDATRTEAADRLRSTKRGGILIAFPHELALSYASSVFASSVQFLSELPAAEIISVGRPAVRAIEEFNARTAAFHGGPPTPEEERLWGLAAFTYAAFKIGPETAMLVTREESQSYEFEDLLVCEADPNHGFPRPSLVDGALCPHHVTTRGTPPRVRRI